jgi:hypothetical protein
MEFSKAVSELPITPKISKAVYILAEPLYWIFRGSRKSQ